MSKFIQVLNNKFDDMLNINIASIHLISRIEDDRTEIMSGTPDVAYLTQDTPEEIFAKLEAAGDPNPRGHFIALTERDKGDTIYLRKSVIGCVAPLRTYEEGLVDGANVTFNIGEARVIAKESVEYIMGILED